MALSRDLYKKIKGMSREEMEGYLNNLYNEAHAEGVQKGLKLMEDLFVKGVEETPGIGPKRQEQILLSVNEKVLEYNKQLQEQQIKRGA